MLENRVFGQAVGGHLPLVLKKFQNLMMRKVMYQLPLMVVVQQELVQ